MRIIKTTIRNRGMRFFVAVFLVFTVPILSMVCVKIFPDAYEYMSNAAKYSDVIPMNTSESRIINNGEFTLYMPQVVPATKEEEIQNEKEPEANEAVLLSRNISETKEDLTVFSSVSGEIYEVTFEDNLGADFIDLPLGGQVRNCTEMSNEIVKQETLVPHKIDVELYTEEPQILIMHTHTTESYEIKEKDYFDNEYTSRSDDPRNGVVAVGAAIAEELSAAGISVIHDGTIHDDQYSGAYSRSLETVEKILSEYPTIKIVLDIHRDAIEDSGSRVSAVTEINGQKAAQVMIISAADDGTYDIPEYLENFHFACAFQQAIESSYPTLTRPVLFQYCHYNQHVTTGSLLIEIGSHGNTIDQAVYSGHLVGKSLAKMFINECDSEQNIIRTMPRFFMDMLR